MKRKGSWVNVTLGKGELGIRMRLKVKWKGNRAPDRMNVCVYYFS